MNLLPRLKISQKLPIVVAGAALIASAAVPLLLFFMGEQRLAALALAFSVLLYWRHADNIGRLLRGEEGRIGASKS